MGRAWWRATYTPRLVAKDGPCALCERTLPLTFHHLIPKKVARRPRFQKRFDKATLAAGVDLCRLCHRAVHRFHDEREEGAEINRLGSAEVRPFFSWAMTQRSSILRQASSSQSDTPFAVHNQRRADSTVHVHDGRRQRAKVRQGEADEAGEDEDRVEGCASSPARRAGDLPSLSRATAAIN